MTSDTGAAHRAVEAVWRIESPRIIAGLVGLVRDVELAEELAHDALVAALEQSPADGIPPNPGAWLMLTAKHRAVDRIRRNERLGKKLSLLGRELEADQERVPSEFDSILDRDEAMGDDLLRLMFISCHPVLSTEARIALTLRLLGGLTTEEIARGFLAAEPTIAKRIVRAKRTLVEEQVPFEVPPPAERHPRLASVLEVLYLVFNEGYSAMAGDDWMRPALCTEALRLGRVLAELMPAEAEVHGLVALMEIRASRLEARLSPAGLPVPLLERPLGPAADQARLQRLASSRAAWEPARTLCPPGRDRRVSRPGASAGADRLDAHRRALSGAGPAAALSGSGTEPGGGSGDGVRARAGPRDRRRPCRGTRAGRLPAPVQRARRPAGQAGPP
jgi:predicted RNA polymerase sigma factor